MRLRYLYLPFCGPLTDTSVLFGREDLITRALNLPRKGTLNFVVGVNGTGKSTLLRAIYGIFRSLSLREMPSLPFTLAWDRTTGDDSITAIFHSSNQKDTSSFFAEFKQVPPLARRQDWEQITIALGRDESHPMIEDFKIFTGYDAITSPFLFSRLPKCIIAYTSGDDEPWEQLDLPIFHPKDEEEGQYRPEDERPPAWNMNREWEEEQPIRISNVLTRYTMKTSGGMQTPPGGQQLGRLSREAIENLQQELGPLEAIRQKVTANRISKKALSDDSYFRIEPRHLKLAGITLALWQTAKELQGRNEERQREAFRNLIIHERDSHTTIMDARRVLNEIDWFWSTHLSITYRDADDRVSPRQHKELLCLVALADEVVAQPLGRQRVVLSLGPSEKISLSEKLDDAFPFGIPGKDVEAVANRIDGCKTGAEAILRVFSEDDKIDSTPMDVFTRLRDWEHTGLLEDISLSIKRLNRSVSDDGEPDDIIITYDQLSDGEQMLLGRMGLLFLLRGQDGSLLLLDEPETHFNDVWKREIVEMVDMGLLNSTAANVIVATHTSIALTDAFAAEVTVLDKQKDGITARNVTGGLFGTDPGEVYMNLFKAESSIGSRSVRILERLLKTDWKGREEELEAVLNILGSSFHRAELRAILNQLRDKTDGTTSS